MIIERTARQAKPRPLCSPSNSWIRTSSRLRPKRRLGTAASSSRVVNVDDRCSAVVLRCSQDSPARTASVSNPTVSALPTGPGFTGRAWPMTAGLPSRCATRSVLAPKEAPHHPQNRFSGGLACRHRRHGAWSVMVYLASSLVRSTSHFTLAFGTIHPRFRPPDRWSGPKVSIASYGMSQPTDTDSFRRNSLLRAAESNQLGEG